MEKKIWVKPKIECVSFPANAYCSACGEGGTNYIFHCNGGSGYLFIDSDKNGTLTPDSDWTWGKKDFMGDWVEDDWGFIYSGSDDDLGHHVSCGKDYIASSEDEFYDGFLFNSSYVGSQWGNFGSENFISSTLQGMVTNVKVWIDSKNKNYHVTKNLKQNTWEIAKS